MDGWVVDKEYDPDTGEQRSGYVVQRVWPTGYKLEFGCENELDAQLLRSVLARRAVWVDWN